MSRIAHLVGSIPLESPEAAMTAALDRVGDNLRTLPDGETGERRNWIIHIVEYQLPARRRFFSSLPAVCEGRAVPVRAT